MERLLDLTNPVTILAWLIASYWLYYRFSHPYKVGQVRSQTEMTAAQRDLLHVANDTDLTDQKALNLHRGMTRINVDSQLELQNNETNNIIKVNAKSTDNSARLKAHDTNNLIRVKQTDAIIERQNKEHSTDQEIRVLIEQTFQKLQEDRGRIQNALMAARATNRQGYLLLEDLRRRLFERYDYRYQLLIGDDPSKDAKLATIEREIEGLEEDFYGRLGKRNLPQTDRSEPKRLEGNEAEGGGRAG